MLDFGLFQLLMIAVGVAGVIFSAIVHGRYEPSKDARLSVRDVSRAMAQTRPMRAHPSRRHGWDVVFSDRDIRGSYDALWCLNPLLMSHIASSYRWAVNGALACGVTKC